MLEFIKTQKQHTRLKIAIRNNCPQLKHFCDGTPCAGTKRVRIAPCKYYINGLCTNTVIQENKKNICLGSDKQDN